MRVKKGNQEFRIDEASLGDYLAQGFDLINDHGEVIRLGHNEQSATGIAMENKNLRRKNRQLEEGIAQRDAQIAELQSELAKLSGEDPDADADTDADALEGQQSLLDSTEDQTEPARPDVKEKNGRKSGK